MRFTTWFAIVCLSLPLLTAAFGLVACVSTASVPGAEDEDGGKLTRWGTEDTSTPDAAAGTDTAVQPKDKKPQPPTAAQLCLTNQQGDAIQTFFSKSCQTESACPCSAVDLGKVIGLMVDGAATSVDLCVMELQDFSVSNALIDRHKAGVATRVVVDIAFSDPDEEYAIEDLHQAGIFPKSDSSTEALMHAKFIVLDGKSVLVSSANFSTYDGRSNANNMLLFESPELAQVFTDRFVSYWSGGEFHQTGNPGNHVMEVGGHDVEVMFGPDNSLIDRLIQAIEQADHAIHFAIFAFTLDEVKEALLERCGEVEILGVYDEYQGNDYASKVKGGWCQQAEIVASDVPVTPGVASDFGFRKLHHKLLIADPGHQGGLVITGSTNWSFSAAQKNDEVMVVVHDPAVVQTFESEFQARFAEGK